ncbi:ABC transporter substrate-binding protein [Synechococcus sp. UW179A]|uniref:substrate-binding periplasmic protein n=1 Tax=Synechococcus sp. UW179A TaxID=2575510 RepID=UPI000E0E90DB|nr:transporter substrate-binding domain-containing protein [Synechococcus sp. UW179A]
MPKRIRSIVLFGLGAFVACTMGDLSCKVHANEKSTNGREPVNVIWHPDPPYALNENEIPTGFEIDLWRMIAENRKIPYRITRANTFGELLEAIGSGRADVAMGGILINENRSKRFKFTFPTATSEFKIYELKQEESTALRLLQVTTSKEVLLIFVGVALIACFFAVPVWLLERNRLNLIHEKKRHQLILILQKTLLLSTDHTQKSKTRIISIVSLFARVLLTAYFASYILKTASNAQKSSDQEVIVSLDNATLKGKTFASLPDSIQESILKAKGIKQISCELMPECIQQLESGLADAILADNQSMQTALQQMPSAPNIKPTSKTLTTLFIAYGMSKNFLDDPRSSAINDAIARSYYDGTYTKLSQTWLRQ